MSHHAYACTGCGRSDFDNNNELMLHEQTCPYIHDPSYKGGARRATDRVSKIKAVELVASLAMEKALEREDPDVLLEVETAILKLREITGESKAFDPDDPTLPALLRRQAD